MKVYSDNKIINLPEEGEEIKNYKMILAAGGVVLNGEGKVLMIFRRGKWDLPKGKVEDNEPIEFCAERETKEETGLKEITLQKFLQKTYHTYTEKGEAILKETHWFLYKTAGVPVLTPQTNEDITEAAWADRADLPDYTSNTFELIKDVLREAELLPANN